MALLRSALLAARQGSVSGTEAPIRGERGKEQQATRGGAKTEPPMRDDALPLATASA